MEFVKELFLAVLGLSLSGVVLILLVRGCAGLFQKRLSKSAVYYLWVAVLLVLLLPLGMSLEGRQAGEPEYTLRYGSANSAGADAVSDYLPGGDEYAEVQQPATDAETEFAGAVQNMSATSVVSPDDIAAAKPQAAFLLEGWASFSYSLATVPFLPAVALIWLVVAAAAFLVVCCRYCRYAFQLRRTVEAVTAPGLTDLMTGKAKLFKSSVVESPLLLGLIKPLVILPEPVMASYEAGSRSHEEIALMLCHELTHYQRKDILVKWAAQAAVCLHWFNPLVRLAGGWLEQYCELSCDEQVCRGLAKEQRLRYGSVLLAVASQEKGSPSALLTSMSSDGEKLKERLKVVKGVRPRKLWEKALCLGVAILVCLAAVFTGMVRLGHGNVQAAPSGRAVTVEEAFVDDLAGSLTMDRTGGMLRFTIPDVVPEGCRLWIHVAGRYFVEDGSGLSAHLFDGESMEAAWEPGKTYTAQITTENLDDFEIEMGLYSLNGSETDYHLVQFRENGFYSCSEPRTYVSWQMAYFETIMNRHAVMEAKLAIDPEYDTALLYGLHDVDGDGEPELFLRTGADDRSDVYTLQYGKLVYLGVAGDDSYILTEQALLAVGNRPGGPDAAGEPAGEAETVADGERLIRLPLEVMGWTVVTEDVIYSLPAEWARMASEIELEDHIMELASQWAWAAYLPDPEERARVYGQLSEIYSEHMLSEMAGGDIACSAVTHELRIIDRHRLEIRYLLSDESGEYFYFREEKLRVSAARHKFAGEEYGRSGSEVYMGYVSLNHLEDRLERLIRSNNQLGWRDAVDRRVRIGDVLPVAEALSADRTKLYLLVSAAVAEDGSVPVQSYDNTLRPAVLIQERNTNEYEHQEFDVVEYWQASGPEDYEEAIAKGFPEEILEDLKQSDHAWQRQMSMHPLDFDRDDESDWALAWAVDTFNEEAETVGQYILRLQDPQLAYAEDGLSKPVGRQYLAASRFGYRVHPLLGQQKLHTGVDYAVGEGTEVYAAASGKVLAAGWNESYGNLVVIDHGMIDGQNLSTVYAHNASFLVAPGEEVQRGQLIAFSGNTGDSFGAHLHFEVRLNGEYVNPQNYLEEPAAS